MNPSHTSPHLLRVTHKVVEGHPGNIDSAFFRSEGHKDKIKKLILKYVEQYKKK